MKPENILISAVGEPLLGDFGLAALQPAAESTEHLAGETTLHSAPEAFEDAALSPAADVYGLASSMYELLLGRGPFVDLPGRGAGLDYPAPPAGPGAPAPPRLHAYSSGGPARVGFGEGPGPPAAVGGIVGRVAQGYRGGGRLAKNGLCRVGHNELTGMRPALRPAAVMEALEAGDEVGGDEVGEEVTRRAPRRGPENSEGAEGRAVKSSFSGAGGARREETPAASGTPAAERLRRRDRSEVAFHGR